MRELIKEYRLALRITKKARLKSINEDDRKILGSCISSLNFAIEYMEKGKHPDNRRAITRLDHSRREIPMDPHSMAFVRAAAVQHDSSDISPKMKKAINDLGIVLDKLTVKEREAYLLVRGSGYSFGDAATLMKLQKGTVQVLVRRSEEKIYSMVSDLTEQGIIFKGPVQEALF